MKNEGHKKIVLIVVPISSAIQPQPVYNHSQLMGRGNETLLKVPISEEVERTKLSIKQKAAELTKKTRGSFRRKNGVGGGGGGADDRAGRNLKLPRERRATQRQRSATKNRRKFQDAIDEMSNGDHDDDEDDDDGNMVSCRIIE